MHSVPTFHNFHKVKKRSIESRFISPSILVRERFCCEERVGRASHSSTFCNTAAGFIGKYSVEETYTGTIEGAAHGD
jgi:hypothetical protein